MNDPGIRKLGIGRRPEGDGRAEDPGIDAPNADGADNPNICISDANGDGGANDPGTGSRPDRDGGADNLGGGVDDSSRGADDSSTDRR